MPDFTPGSLMGERFEVMGILGRGGMATVYLAFDRLRREQVALKVLHDHLASQSSMRSRLRREVLASSRLRHPNALVAHELHDLDGRLALSMRLHSGRTLLDHVQAHGPYTAEALERLARGVAGALAEAHRHGVVHRDVTPTNVLVEDDGEGVLSDFGLARLDDQRTATATSALGTAGYAAPEVYDGNRADPRSDLYSLGAVLYFAATGTAPFHAASSMGTLQRQMAEDHLPLSEARSDLPPHLTAVVDALLRKDLDLRPQGATEVIDALEGAPVAAAPVVARIEEVPQLPIGLAEGRFTVVVREHREDRERRQQLRRARRRAQQQGFEASVDALVKRIATGVRHMLGIQSEHGPEESLSRAVATTAGLPADALVVPPEVLEKKFRLVEAVDAVVASNLAQAAWRAGFNADVTPLETPAEPQSRMLGAIMTAILLAFAIFSLLNDSGSGIFFLFFFFVPIPLLITRSGSQRKSGEDVDRIPIAYRRDLRPYVAEVHAHLTKQLAPPRRETAPTVRVVQVRGPEPRVVEKPKEKPAPRPTGDSIDAMLQRNEERLQSVLGELHRFGLPDVAARDLRGTLDRLREKSRALGAEARRIKADLAGKDDNGEMAAATRIEARLERLRTLERSGQMVDTTEIARLERSLDAHRETLADVEDQEVRLTRLLGEMLEIGAAVARVQRQLRNEADVARSVAGLVQQLEREAEAADAALRELEPPPLRRAGLESTSVDGRLPERYFAATSGRPSK